LKTRLRLIIFLLFITFYSGFSQSFKVFKDTISIDLRNIGNAINEVYLSKIIKHQNDYYCVLREFNDNNYFIKISKSGEIINFIDVPELLKRDFFRNLFLKNDTLFIKTEFSNSYFCFDLKKSQWYNISKFNEYIFEDSSYILVNKDYGEWGNSTWFIDKKSKKQYVIGIPGTVINKIENCYYITNKNQIHKIAHPNELKLCDSNCLYNKVGPYNNFRQCSNFYDGSEVLYKDTSYSFFGGSKSNTYMLTSFVSNSQLYHVFSDSNFTYIGKVINKSFVPILNLGDRYLNASYDCMYRGSNFANNKRILPLRKDARTDAVLEIEDSLVFLHYIQYIEKDTPKYIGNDSFATLVNLLRNEKLNITLPNIIDFEKQTNGIDLKENLMGIGNIGYFSTIYNNENYKTKKFIKAENRYLIQNTYYLYENDNQKLKSIFINWEKTKKYKEIFSYFTKTRKDMQIDFVFKRKQEEIVNILTSKLGINPIKRKKCLFWKSKIGDFTLYNFESNIERTEIIMLIEYKN